MDLVEKSRTRASVWYHANKKRPRTEPPKKRVARAVVADGAGILTKTCGGPCGRVLHVGCFYTAKLARGGLSHTCKDCFKASQRDYRYRRLYGITAAEFDAMLQAQGGRCAICRADSASPERSQHFHVDHDHATGRVRGLLCLKCNVLLANARDDSAILQAAIDYLR